MVRPFVGSDSNSKWRKNPVAGQYVDEVLFGYEVIEEMPRIMGELVALASAQS